MRLIYSLYHMSLLIMISGLLASCIDAERLSKIGQEPPLEPTQPPMHKQGYAPVYWPEAEQPPSTEREQYVNSLWNDNKTSFFADRQLRQIGDILKVSIQINDRAELDNETERERDDRSELDGSSIFGLESLMTSWLPGDPEAASLLDIRSRTTNSGTGTIEREERIETEIAAMVTQILPNGNLIIHGDQEVRVNHEIRKITISGIVNPTDIASDNSIPSNMIAEARISYGGRGKISEMQQPRYGHQVIEALSPL